MFKNLKRESWRVMEINHCIFFLQLVVFLSDVNSLHLLWGENKDSCCLFGNSYLNCTMALFPMGRPELIPV